MGTNHPLGKAVVYSILFCAITHVAISFFIGVMHGDLAIMSMFHILGFDLLWPELATGATNAVLGVLMVILIWVIFVIILTSHQIKESKGLGLSSSDVAQGAGEARNKAHSKVRRVSTGASNEAMRRGGKS